MEVIMGSKKSLSRRTLLRSGLSLAGGLAFSRNLNGIAPFQGKSGGELDLVGAAPICNACGTQFLPSSAERPQRVCPICLDERQYVPSEGQGWSSMANLRATHHNEWRIEEPSLSSIQTYPTFAIGQRALLVETPAGNVLWDCLSLLDETTIAAVHAKGGIVAIAVSHPHFYASMVEWAHAFQAPVYLHEADRAWVMRPDPMLRFWSGATHPLPGGLSLVHTGGHFKGSQVLYWPTGADGKGAILVGDQPNLCADRRWATFMRSFPNYIPLAESETNRVMESLRRLRFDRLYGWTPDRILRSGAKASLERSLERHIRALRGEHGVVGAQRV